MTSLPSDIEALLHKAEGLIFLSGLSINQNLSFVVGIKLWNKSTVNGVIQTFKTLFLQLSFQSRIAKRWEGCLNLVLLKRASSENISCCYLKIILINYAWLWGLLPQNQNTKQRIFGWIEKKTAQDFFLPWTSFLIMKELLLEKKDVANGPIKDSDFHFSFSGNHS